MDNRLNKRGIDVFLELLGEFGVRVIFGNPGTTELPLNDALVGDSRLEYVLGLHEGPVMAMADGYAMASRSIAVVNLHASCGLGNAMGQLYNAHREHTPLLVTAGQQDRRLRQEEPILAGDLVAVTSPWTKFSAEVQRVEDLPTLLRRAVATALTPPTGPVFLSLPVDVQLAAAEELDMRPIQLHDHQTRPPAKAIEQARRVLMGATNPVILAGSRVCDCDAFEPLAAIADSLGAPVYQESLANHGRMGFPADHPLRGEVLPLWSPDVYERLKPFDAALVVGMDLLRQYVHHEPAQPIPKHLTIVHLDEDAWQLGKNVATEAAVVGDVRQSLLELQRLVNIKATDDFRDAATQRRDRWSQEHQAARRELQAEIQTARDARPMSALAFMSAIANVLPENAAVIEEAVTTTNATLERLGAIKEPSGFFAQRGWTLGWGIGCAIGVKLAWPDRPVLALIGDGAAMYGIAGLWTAARRKLPVVFVICNNSSYSILKTGAKSMGLPAALDGRFIGMDIHEPSIDFVLLAQSMGVAAHRAETVEEVERQVRAAFARNEPTLIESPIAPAEWENG